MNAPAKVFGRTNEPVAPVWREHADGGITAGGWHGLTLQPADLDRRGGARLRDRAARLGRGFDFVLVRDLLANDLKVGWPLHRLQQFRHDRLFRFVVIDTQNALEAEWIAANAPVHGVMLTFAPADMAAGYRVFDAAGNAGVALIGRGESADAAALQLATPQLVATLLAPTVDEPTPLPADQAAAMWTAYAAAHTEPPKLRAGHPPDFGT